jgi:hypothetical protein
MIKKTLAIKLVGLTGLLVIVAGVVGVKPASAALNLNIDPGNSIPSNVRQNLINCDQGTQSPGFDQWISPAGNSSTTVVSSVPYGASSVDLQYYFNGAVCKANSDVGNTNVKVVGASIVDGNGNPAAGSVTGVVGQTLGLDFHPDYRGTTGAYRQANTPTFQFNAPPGGFTNSGIYYVKLDTSIINHFESNNTSLCVIDGRNAGNPTNFAACPPAHPVLAIFVDVQPKPVQDPVGYAEADCNEVRGWSHNNDNQFNPTTVHIYIDGKFVGARTANQANRQNAIWTDWYYMGYPAEYRDANPHTVRVYAISPPGGTNPLIGTANVPSCVKANVEPSDCNSVHGWAYNGMNPSKSYDVDVYINGPAGTGRKIGRFPANLSSPDIKAAFPADFPGNTQSNNRFSIPKSTLDGYKDAFTHTLFVYMINDYEGGINPYLGNTTIGPCGMPSCGSFNIDGGAPEAGQSFTAKANYIYSNTGAFGYALRYDMGLDINGVRNVTSSGWSVEGSSNFDGTAIPNGATRSNMVQSGPITIGAPGNISGVWQVQWVIPADSTIVNTLFNAYRAAGGNSPYPGESTGFYGSPNFSMNTGGMLGVYKSSPTGLWYGLLNCTNNSGDHVVTKPYVKVYGNDVAAGSKFADTSTTTCSPPTTPTGDGIGLWAFNKKAGSYYGGASSQFASVSRGKNNSFSSGSQHNPNVTGTASPPAGLSFGNMVSTAGTVPDDADGWSPLSHCIPDYFSAHSANGADYRNNSTFVNPFGLFIKTIPVKQQTATFVDGDAYITNDIVYATEADGSWKVTTDIPNYYLIVKGDIYISAGVQNLAGTYIAQPRDDGSRGRIFTCTSTTTLWNSNQLYNNCKDKPLTVTGSFIAKQIWYQRVRGTVGNSIPNAPTVVNGNELPSSANIAEIFNFSQETYLAPIPPALSGVVNATSTGRNERYDGITSLPPIL